MAGGERKSPLMRRSNTTTRGGADTSPTDEPRSTSSCSVQASQPGVESVGMGGFVPTPQRAMQHPFREVSQVERKRMLHRSNTARNEEEWRKSELSMGSMLTKMEELNSRLQDLQGGQDDIRRCLLQMRCCGAAPDVGHAAPADSPDAQAHHVGFASAVGSHLRKPAAREERADESSLEPEHLHSREPAGMARQLVECRMTEEHFQSEGASDQYCGFPLRREFVDIGEKVHREGTQRSTASKLYDEDAPAMQSTRIYYDPAQSTNSRVLLSQRRRLQFPAEFKAIHPDSVLRLWIDLGSMTVLLFDSASVPYQLSFEPDTLSGFWFWTNWLTLGFWTTDIFLGFVTGYYDHGGPELRIRKISMHYLRTFFLIDLTTVTCDWISIILTMILDGSSGARNATLLKFFRILKLNRVLRLVGALQSGKFGQMYDRIINWSRQLGLDHQLQFFLNVLQLMFAILWLNHIGCCMWFSVQANAVRNWEESSNIGEYNRHTDSAEWAYLLGFYWSMTSMVSGASIMSPTNVGELVFTILYVLFGLLVGSTLISSLAAMLLDLQMSNKEQRDNVRLLRQYLFQQGLEVGLALDVEKEAVARMSKEKRLGATEVPCLGLLSPAMRSALHYAIYCQPLKEHPFLGVCHILSTPAELFTKDICENAIDHDTQLPGFQVFPTAEHGDACEGPLFVVLGELEYLVKESEVGRSGNVSNADDHASNRSDSSTSRQSTMVSSGQWLCELANWLQWSHRGSLNACIPCEYIRLRADVLLNLFQHFEDLRWLAWQYAIALCKACEDEPEQLTDLPLREDLHESVVLSMKPEGRRRMSEGPLMLLKAAANGKQTGWLPFSRVPFSNLRDQVDQGKCDLVMKSGQVMRIVSVVVLQLTREVEKSDGQMARQILAQISKSTKVEDAKCQLPGGKVRAGELPREALDRLLNEQLYALQQVGLRIDRLTKVDSVVELVEEAKPGDFDLGVSSLADLHVGSLIQLREGHRSETKKVASLDPDHKRIEIDQPLENHYDIGTRINNGAVEIKKKTSMSSGNSFGVDTKYIRTIFRGSLGAGDNVGKTLRRRDRHESEGLVSETLGSDPTADYSAVLLFPGHAPDAAPNPDKSGAKGGNYLDFCPVDRDSGILCAWIDEKDYASLSARKAVRVKKWVEELQDSIQETLNEEYARPLDESAQRTYSSGPEMLPLTLGRSFSGSLALTTSPRESTNGVRGASKDDQDSLVVCTGSTSPAVDSQGVQAI